ncbi:MAG: cysteine--tRNA ligase [Clostridiales bacterium]|nr:cysteine--tRNA ligase [Clostridiales bacterium]
MDTLYFYNTLTRKKEKFAPIAPPEVKTYSCGPTVYNYAHIGNLRTYVFMDELRRVLKFAGYNTKSVMNVTDVGHLTSDGDDGEDKMQSAARKQNKSPEQIAAYYSEIFFKDLARLNILTPEIISKATDNIDEMIDFVKTLCDMGYGYETDDGIYFDISKFADYGKLSRCNLEDALAGARVAVNTQKRHPADFALWKKAEPNHIMQWKSPWGMGYPGWHIECSTMSKKFLGERFDIHTGGVDHIPIHHENEIAQSEALEGHKVVNYWMHGEFMLVDGGKMSKSLGNVYTIDDLIARGYSPLAFRYFCLNTHYRNKLNFTFDGLSGAATAYNRLRGAISACENAPKADAETASKVKAQRAAIIAAVYDDLNFPLALGELWTMAKLPACHEIYDAAAELNAILGLDLHTPLEQSPVDDIPDEIKAIAEERFKARQNKDWATSDKLRNELDARGYAVLDSKTGYELKKK